MSRKLSTTLSARLIFRRWQSTDASNSLPLLKHTPEASVFRKNLPKRPGLAAYKQGMTTFFKSDGTRVPATVLFADRPQVTDVRTLEKHGYTAVQVGIGSKKVRNVTKPELGHFIKAGVPVKRDVVELRISPRAELPQVGADLSVSIFKVGSYVDVKAICKGKGFAGPMKRHGFSGSPASHGVSLTHRSHGSIGQSTTPGRVLPGKRMAGHMGGHNVTVTNLQVLQVLPEHDIVVVQGHVPGPKKGVVRIRDSIRPPKHPKEL
ncbi:hypothetical protein CANCADRAFT_29973 [Tortispora caseinolytica NRRL Y-17796]|uniref:Large ribosomal subunit protein uL3m n=1 Tax=Tortispora caseinolytica NRRL Y-17796 TaxID=767744 RepID=A0A1E4TIJ7_9ASCO|nr:hypothetical protein CANCADRAFT_29973 [Tortispora caseinolytica NRRL Y-17796]